MQENKWYSACHNAEVKVITGGEGTSYWVCVLCENPCNASPAFEPPEEPTAPPPEPTRGWEVEFDKKAQFGYLGDGSLVVGCWECGESINRDNIKDFIRQTEAAAIAQTKKEMLTSVLEELKHFTPQWDDKITWKIYEEMEEALRALSPSKPEDN